MTQINIADDFSRFPTGREYPDDGDKTGDIFRENFLVKALTESDGPVFVSLDGVAGPPSSFLDEAFAGLIRYHGYSVEVLKKRLKVITSDPSKDRFIDLIWSYIREAKATVA